MTFDVVSFTGREARDHAECDTPEQAVAAARQLLLDAEEAGAGEPRCAIYLEGRLVRSDITYRHLKGAS